jgi:magnesium transporter
MVFRYTYTNGVWVDLENPTEDEVRSVAKEFSIGERLQMELHTPTLTPLVINDTGATFLILHFPTHGTSDGEIRDQEIDFVIGDAFIVTVRYEVIAPLHRLKKLLETQQLISPHETLTTEMLLEVLFAHLYTSVRDHVSHTAGRLNHVEHDMFHGAERTTVRTISNLSREFLHIEASLADQEEPLNRFLKAVSARRSFKSSFAEYAERILAEHTQVARLVATYRAVATELRETNATLLEVRQNDIMKTLTVITFIMLPLELTTFVFGMHALGTPLEDNPNAFWIIITLMLGIGTLMVAFLARKRWLF